MPYTPVSNRTLINERGYWVPGSSAEEPVVDPRRLTLTKLLKMILILILTNKRWAHNYISKKRYSELVIQEQPCLHLLPNLLLPMKKKRFRMKAMNQTAIVMLIQKNVAFV